MPRGVPNKKKALKRGRKTKEEVLQQKHEELLKEFQRLDEISTRQVSELYHKLDNEYSKQNELRATIHNLNVVISTLGDRIYLLQKQNSGIIENRNQFAIQATNSNRERTTY